MHVSGIFVGDVVSDYQEISNLWNQKVSNLSDFLKALEEKQVIELPGAQLELD